MPDWVTHVAVAWTLCRLLRFKYSDFNPPNTALVMVGSVVPDLVKMGILFDLAGLDWWDPIQVLHLPIGSLLIAGIAALFFREKKTAFIFLSLGIVTHYCLDLLLKQVADGIYIFYPLSWTGFHLDVVNSGDYIITIVALIIATAVYLISNMVEKKGISRSGKN